MKTFLTTAAALLSATMLASTAASAAPIVSYDIINGRASGFGGWTNNYSGTQTTVAGLTTYTGGSGTMNDGIVPGSVQNDQLFFTSDGSTIIGYFSSLQSVSAIELLSANFNNGIPGNIAAALVTIGGVSQRVVSTGFGSIKANGEFINERFVLSGALASAVGNSFSLSQIETTGGNGDYFAIGELTATSANATSGVPEPATWAMMTLGFGAMGFAMRRKAKVSTRIRFA